MSSLLFPLNEALVPETFSLSPTSLRICQPGEVGGAFRGVQKSVTARRRGTKHEMGQMEDLSASLAATKESVDELSLQMLQNEGVESKFSDMQETLKAILKATKEQTAGIGKHASSLRKETQKQNAKLQAAMVKQHEELRKDILKQNADNAVLLLKQTAALIAAVQEQTKANEKLAAPVRESGKRKRAEDTAADAGNERETSATDSQTSAAEKLVSSSLNGKGTGDAGEGTSTAGGSKKMKAPAPVPAPAKEVMSVNATGPREGTCTWTIPNFSKLKVDPWGDGKLSDTFSIGGHKWRLLVIPRGYRIAKDKSVSLFLQLADAADKLPKGWKVTAAFSLSVICQHDPEKSRKQKSLKNRDFCAFRGLGFFNLISLTDFHNAANGFLVNDTVTFQAKIEVEKPAKAR